MTISMFVPVIPFLALVSLFFLIGNFLGSRWMREGIPSFAVSLILCATWIPLVNHEATRPQTPLVQLAAIGLFLSFAQVMIRLSVHSSHEIERRKKEHEHRDAGAPESLPPLPVIADKDRRKPIVAISKDLYHIDERGTKKPSHKQELVKAS